MNEIILLQMKDKKNHKRGLAVCANLSHTAITFLQRYITLGKNK